MDWDERAELKHSDLTGRWGGLFKVLRGPIIADWVSYFRDGHPSEIIDDHFGSFNWSCRVRFKDGLEWLVRFAVPGRVMDGDEKIRREVATMYLIREQTTIPVPKIHAWGFSKNNTLGLGPFIIMDYIQGELLGDLWKEVPEPIDGQILRSDIKERDLHIIYRQIAGFMLDLSKLEFPHAASLCIRDDLNIHPDLGPLTAKMQEIESHGGIKVGGDRSRTFPSTTEYFNFVAEQDLEQLHDQANSVDHAIDARAKYKFRKQFNALIPRFVAQEHNRAPFRLVCDDMRYGNMIVNNATDLKIVAVLDWEWTYTAPYQMFYSPPRWLSMKKPIYWQQPNGSEFTQYKACLEIFLRELEQEESERNKGLPHFELRETLSGLMRQSMADGKFWYHELLYACFTGAENTAWKAICNMHPDHDELAPISEPELDSFVEKKMDQLREYEAEWNAMCEKRKVAEL